MTSTQDTPGKAPARRKPRIALMGEFSAGKSTLTNLLIGSRAIPMRVTATQLPPVWIALGQKAPYREDLVGNRTPVDLLRIEDVPVEDTRFIRLFKPTSEILEVCDLIDLPGISDPNMASDVWARALEHADGVIWLTHATQAWRQSEAAVWESLAAEYASKSLLLLTRMDKIVGDRDRLRVIKRVEKETRDMFRAVLPISLTEAMASAGDQAKWAASGAEAFNGHFIDLIAEMVGEPAARSNVTHFPARPPLAEPASRAAPPQPRPAGTILPRRIVATGTDDLPRNRPPR